MRIYKYEAGCDQRVSMPKDAEILSVGVQQDDIMIWARVNPDAPMVDRKIIILGTGHEISEKNASLPFIGTVFMGSLVFHVFDGGQ